ncbi:MAG: NAD(P)H-dependent oxidoreductase subunit E, partial [Hyphomicrobiaceae bacterium]|nr:NAD(P)H-dependent oxidoreductase subunit E [Hyphomicrobiaceae bacterium]
MPAAPKPRRNSGKRAVHPGAGRRDALIHPKGRVLAEEDLVAVRALIGTAPYERPLLIEYLHKIQDANGCLPASHMHALAELMRIPMAEVYEVATFYDHFDVVRDGEERPEPVTIRVCDSLSCMIAGAERLIAELEAFPQDGVRVMRAPCIGSCHTAPAAHVGKHHVDHATAETLRGLAAAKTTSPLVPEYVQLDAYRASGGYKVLQSCLDGQTKVDDV